MPVISPTSNSSSKITKFFQNRKAYYVAFIFYPHIDGVSLVALQCGRPEFNSWVWKIHWRRDRLPTPVFLGFSGGSDGKESACRVGDLSSIPGLGRSPGKGHGNPLQYSCLEKPHGQRSLVGYSPWNCKELDTTE